jgi:exopolyphosphatase / guanosine-5'-triphosphate,3'-diphosphate pyrophosphatase
MPGVITHTPLSYEGSRLVLSLPDRFAALYGGRLERRFKTLANLLEREPEIRVGDAALQRATG